MKIFTLAALAVLLSSGLSFAQSDSGSESGSNSGTDSSTSDTGSGTDSGNYMTGPNIERFYTDETMSSVRPQAELKAAWDAMSEKERADAQTACSGNKDTRWSTLCNSLGAM